MRILIATQSLAIVGGAETYLRSLLPLLKTAGHDLLVAVADTSADPSTGILARCPDIPVLSWSRQSPSDMLAAIAEWAPDVAYQHGLQNPDWEHELARRYPSVLYAHSYYGTCISGNKCHSWPRPKICHRVLGPACLALYPVRGCGGSNPLTMVRMYKQQQIHRKAIAQHRMVLAASGYVAEEIRQHGVPENRVRVVPYFPPDTRPDSGPPTPRSRSDQLIFTGRITKVKGLDHLIAAIPMAARALGRALKLVVAGDGPERKRAEAQALKVGVQARFLGWVDTERRNAEMRLADLIVVPSLWPEPFGLVGIEAGCVGLPAVGYAVGGIPDWLIPEHSGESAGGDRLDPSRLASALERALTDDAHWNALRHGAWTVAQRFTAERHVRDLQRVLCQVVDSGMR